MSDGLLIALAGIIVAAIAAIPATITALSARRHAVGIADTLGVKNGNGDVVTMLARGLAENAQILRQQEQITTRLNDLGDTEHRLVELAEYTHNGIHELRNKLTPLKGQVDMLWRKVGFPPIDEEDK